LYRLLKTTDAATDAVKIYKKSTKKSTKSTKKSTKSTKKSTKSTKKSTKSTKKKHKKKYKNVFFIIFDLIIFSQSLYKKLVKPFYKICHLEKVSLPRFIKGLHNLHLERLREND
jgi:hypothetical protein